MTCPRCQAMTLVGVLTPTQKVVLKCLADGLTIKATADKLGIAYKTAEYHRNNMKARLNIYDVAGMTKLAMRAGLVD